MTDQNAFLYFYAKKIAKYLMHIKIPETDILENVCIFS